MDLMKGLCKLEGLPKLLKEGSNCILGQLLLWVKLRKLLVLFRNQLLMQGGILSLFLLIKYLTFPHRADGDYGAAKVMPRHASPGTGVSAGGTVRIVPEMAGVKNALGKQLGSNNALNNAKVTVAAVQKMRQFREVAWERGIPMEELWK